MSVSAPAMPSLAATIETSCDVPGNRPVSERNWIIVIGPNQNRCRGRMGLSVELIYDRPFGSFASGPVIETPLPDDEEPQVKSVPMLHDGVPGSGCCRTGPARRRS